jgi:hypothetical protein
LGSTRVRYRAPMPSRLLPIYLNDHLAGATAGVELARRSLNENKGTEFEEFLRGLLSEIVEDRATLLQLMERLAVRRSRSKTAAAWAAEKVGRLKLNGQIKGYSPLSRLVELEGLATGIESKRSLWLALAQIRDRDDRLRAIDLDALAERARSQRERLEPHRLAAAAEAFG